MVATSGCALLRFHFLHASSTTEEFIFLIFLFFIFFIFFIFWGGGVFFFLFK